MPVTKAAELSVWGCVYALVAVGIHAKRSAQILNRIATLPLPVIHHNTSAVRDRPAQYQSNGLIFQYALRLVYEARSTSAGPKPAENVIRDCCKCTPWESSAAKAISGDKAHRLQPIRLGLVLPCRVSLAYATQPIRFMSAPAIAKLALSMRTSIAGGSYC